VTFAEIRFGIELVADASKRATLPVFFCRLYQVEREMPAASQGCFAFGPFIEFEEKG